MAQPVHVGLIALALLKPKPLIAMLSACTSSVLPLMVRFSAALTNWLVKFALKVAVFNTPAVPDASVGDVAATLV